MSPAVLFSITAAVIFSLALHGLIAARHLLRKLIAVNLLGSSVFLVLVVYADRPDGDPDPVPHAMVLTGIVVTVAAIGLTVTMIRRTFAEDQEAYLPEDQDGGGSAD